MASGSGSGDPLKVDMLEKQEVGNRVTLQTVLRIDSAELVLEERDGDSGDSVVDSCMRVPSNKPMSKDKRTMAEMTTSRMRWAFGCGFGT